MTTAGTEKIDTEAQALQPANEVGEKENVSNADEQESVSAVAETDSDPTENTVPTTTETNAKSNDIVGKVKEAWADKRIRIGAIIVLALILIAIILPKSSPLKGEWSALDDDGNPISLVFDRGGSGEMTLVDSYQDTKVVLVFKTDYEKTNKRYYFDGLTTFEINFPEDNITPDDLAEIKTLGAEVENNRGRVTIKGKDMDTSRKLFVVSGIDSVLDGVFSSMSFSVDKEAQYLSVRVSEFGNDEIFFWPNN